MQIGLEIGSTTIKIAVLDDAGNLLFSKYQRHYSQIAARILELHKELMAKFPTLRTARLAISGSAGIGIAEWAQDKTNIPNAVLYAVMIALCVVMALCARQVPDRRDT